MIVIKSSDFEIQREEVTELLSKSYSAYEIEIIYNIIVAMIQNLNENYEEYTLKDIESYYNTVLIEVNKLNNKVMDDYSYIGRLGCMLLEVTSLLTIMDIIKTKCFDIETEQLVDITEATLLEDKIIVTISPDLTIDAIREKLLVSGDYDFSDFDSKIKSLIGVKLEVVYFDKASVDDANLMFPTNVIQIKGVGPFDTSVFKEVVKK